MFTSGIESDDRFLLFTEGWRRTGRYITGETLFNLFDQRYDERYKPFEPPQRQTIFIPGGSNRTVTKEEIGRYGVDIIVGSGVTFLTLECVDSTYVGEAEAVINLYTNSILTGIGTVTVAVTDGCSSDLVIYSLNEIAYNSPYITFFNGGGSSSYLASYRYNHKQSISETYTGGTTDENGDMTKVNPFAGTSARISVNVLGTTPYHAQVHTFAGGNYTVRFFNMDGTPAASTQIDFYVIATYN